MKTLDFFSMASSLSSMQRYSQNFLNKKESVLEHTGFVVLFCCLIAQELVARGREIDIGVLLSKAALHDVDEIITGDVPRPTKYFDEETRKTFERIEHHGMSTLIERMALQKSTYDIWKNSKSEYEGSIVAIADVFAVVFKVWEETHLLGNKGFANHKANVTEHLEKMLLSLEDEYLCSIVSDGLELIRGM
ncbi:MAG TPA: YfbR-like 5'-deoxynucleotidase [Candidatus Paceibacterota bacterium]